MAFAYPDGIDATPPPDMIMTNLIDFTSTGERGKADSRQLRYFSGTAKYFTELTLSANQAKRAEMVSLGEISSGLARVAVNGIDCGTVWCAPWKAYGAGAFREGVNKIEICYINNWSNRLTGDCFLPESERVTRSSLRYWTVPRRKSDPSRPWLQIPTVYSGPSVSDKLQASGILGPVNIELRK